MIERLFIQNLILVEKAKVEFGPGLNIITGETGSGKSALLSAIRALLGAKGDTSQIQSGAPFATIVAEFIPSTPLDWLEEEGLSPAKEGPVTIRREIHRSGKSRCFFEDQQINLSTLKRVVGTAIELVDQSSSQTLCSSEEQRICLDTYATLSKEVSSLAHSFEEERQLIAQLIELKAEKERSHREEERAKEDLGLIDEVNWLEGEEEKLSQEHTLLTNAQELQATSSAVVSLLSESQTPLIPLLKRTAHSLESLIAVDPRLKEPYESIKRSALELEEASFSLRSYVDRLDADPGRLMALEERLASLEKLKRRFGPRSEIERLRKTLSEKIDHLSGIDEKIDQSEKWLKTLSEQNRAKAQSISHARQKAALSFELLITKELHSLNLPQAQFKIHLQPKDLTATGSDAIEFRFSANPGYPPLPLQQCASGGELSRLLLSIKIVLADLEKSTCLIFDEIDSNVGGQTAAILGAKLQTLSQKRQVICVTHFVQVARCASHHFLVSKKEAITSITKLKPQEQEEEFNRMLGTGPNKQRNEV